MHLFTPNHVKLLNSCYPPTSTLLTAGPDYSPNSHELSRLTYYASNNPGKLGKIGSELEKRLKLECRKAKAGNIRSRASLLISLSIFRSLATECRRDIALLSSSLIGSVDFTLDLVMSDLEVVARAASVFTAWTTYTNGHLIGADRNLTSDYLSILDQFATLSSSKSADQETQNRMRLIGLAALTAALNSEALYNDIGNFGSQVSTILRPIMVILFETAISTLDQQSSDVKEAPSSAYLAEFRIRPALERRAASIHIHIDGDKGPSTADVSDASLHALFSLLSHANGAQLGYIMQSSFDNLDTLQSWTSLDHCCWYAQKIAEWAQYQYRYVVPTWLVDRLITHEDNMETSPIHKTLTKMVTSVFSSSTPLINLSSSDIMSNLLTLLLRRISASPGDPILLALVECISSLGCHVYYSDQIQDLAGELVNRLVVIEVQGIPVRDKSISSQSRSSAIRCILEGLLGLIRAANVNDLIDDVERPSGLELGKKRRVSLDTSRTAEERLSRRTKVPPDIWQDTLSLLCDADLSVRKECLSALVYYLTQEMPKHGEIGDLDGAKYSRRLQGVLPNISRVGTKFLNSVHAYVYILATSPTLSTPLPNATQSTYDDTSTGLKQITGPDHNLGETTSSLQTSNRRSITAQHGPRPRKESLVLRLLEKTPSQYTASAEASEEDYANILKVLTTVQMNLPIHGLFTGIPMLLALNAALNTEDIDVQLLQRVITIKTVIAHVWLVIGRVWKVQQLVALAEKANVLLSLFPTPQPPSASLLGIDVNAAILLVTSSKSVQEAVGFDQEGLYRRLTTKWTPELALRDFESSSGYESSFRGDGISPLLKISPALMHIENISLQSLARSARGLGVTDLREALEGRNSMSNPALARPPSVSTLDHAASSFMGETHIRLTQTRSRSRAKKRSPNGTADVRDVLSRLGISKQNSNLLKATFPALQKPNHG